ncbi:Misato segment II tubulin-like domain-containing protein [Phlebopus sp. FC_14]|nr:Misato segment II tubulin-like domain-containing protein [Phlebopus sp. FC_14]
MREIIYIQAGSFSNYIGTHFWNTQESYFTYDEGEPSIADHGISFMEGRDPYNNPTLCPRLLAFDHKSNFGTLAKASYTEEHLGPHAPWEGPVVREEQARIPESEYHALLDREGDELDDEGMGVRPDVRIRYWSDFSRVFFDPKSIQAVPDASGIIEGDWRTNRESFQRYDEDTELMDSSLRLLIENCDNFQGMQMTHDMPTFGGFSHELLTSFRDEHPKATIMSFAGLSDLMPSNVDLGDSFQTKQVLNDSICLTSLTGLCDLTIPVLTPRRWLKSAHIFNHYIDHDSLYHSSAVLSANLETATLPLRLKGDHDDLASFIAHLNWWKSSPFAFLSGRIFPNGHFSGCDEQPDANFSFQFEDNRTPFARRDVFRGFSEDDLRLYNTLCDTPGLEEPCFVRTFAPAYPIPTSFPAISHGSPLQSLKLLSSLATSASIAASLSRYASFVEASAKRRDGTLLSTGLESDEVAALADVLWQLVDGYDAEIEKEGSEYLGEDEE